MFSFFKKPKKVEPLRFKVAISTSADRIMPGYLECAVKPAIGSIVKAQTVNGEEVGRLLDLRSLIA